MIAQALRSTIRRRPISSLAATTSITAVGYANYIEYNAIAKANDNNDTLSSTIPRSHYDPNAIAHYWEQRPISIAKRILNVAYELGPLAGEYLMEFQIRPWVCGSLMNDVVADNDGDNDDDDDATEEEQRKKLELETELSQKLRSSLTRLGPTFVKVGQQLSIRPDLVSPVVLHELQRLCDAVPPFEDEIAMKVLAEELSLTMGDDHADTTNKPKLNGKEARTATILNAFEEMPQLVASASLGQVYKATLRSNNDDSSTIKGANSKTSKKQVAIKIQRPDMLQTVSLDLFLLISYGKTVDKLCSILTNQIPYHEKFLNGFANGAFMELNYIQEAENQIYFRNELHSRFHGTKNTSNEKNKFSILPFLPSILKSNNNKTSHVEKVIVPKVYEQFTTQRVLVSEWIDGIPLAQAPKGQIRELIPIGVELFLCQLLDIGRFHADPHPG